SPPPTPSPLSLHDALPISPKKRAEASDKSARKRLVIAAYLLSRDRAHAVFWLKRELATARTAHCNSIDQDSGALVSRATASCARSEEHTSELQSLAYLVCR